MLCVCGVVKCIPMILVIMTFVPLCGIFHCALKLAIIVLCLSVNCIINNVQLDLYSVH